MKYAALLLVSLFAIPALADSIPVPPITSVSFSGASTGIFFNYPNTYLGSSNLGDHSCSLTTCLLMQAQLMPDGSFGKDSGAHLWGGDTGIFGSLGKITLNSQTDVLSGIFWGKEDIFTSGAAWYTVKGTFTENLGTGTGSLNLTSGTFIGATAVPEPSTILMLGTGLLAIAGSVRRKLRACTLN
jgi:PEP-CTERM motif-containing protein